MWNDTTVDDVYWKDIPPANSAEYVYYTGFLLLEDGEYLLLEDGGRIGTILYTYTPLHWIDEVVIQPIWS
jgi:hypothetical protein